MNRNRKRSRFLASPTLSVALAMLSCVAGAASATNSISLAATPSSGPSTELSVVQGESITLYVRMNFDDSTVGGGVALLYDRSLLRLDQVVFDEALDDDPALRCPAVAGGPACPGVTSFLSFGNLLGLAGGRSVARLELTALDTGTSQLGVDAGLPFSDIRGGALPVVFVPAPVAATSLVAALSVLATLGLCRRLFG